MYLPDIEGMGEQEIFGFGVAPRALGGSGEPGGADLHRIRVVGALKRGARRPAPLLNVQIARGSNDPVLPLDREGHAAAGIAFGQGELDVALRVLDAGWNAGVAILVSGLRRRERERAGIGGREGTQRHGRALKQRLSIHSGRSLRLLPLVRRGLQELGELLLPESRLAGGAATGRLVARGNQEHEAVLHPLDLAIEQAELRRVAVHCPHEIDATYSGGNARLLRARWSRVAYSVFR